MEANLVGANLPLGETSIILILHPYLLIMAIFLQWPLSSAKGIWDIITRSKSQKSHIFQGPQFEKFPGFIQLHLEPTCLKSYNMGPALHCI